MTNHVNITLYLIRLEMELDKEHIRHYPLFCFHQKKSTADDTELFVGCMVKMI